MKSLIHYLFLLILFFHEITAIVVTTKTGKTIHEGNSGMDDVSESISILKYISFSS